MKNSVLGPKGQNRNWDLPIFSAGNWDFHVFYHWQWDFFNVTKNRGGNLKIATGISRYFVNGNGISQQTTLEKCDADKGKSRFARKKSPSGKRALHTWIHPVIGYGLDINRVFSQPFVSLRNKELISAATTKMLNLYIYIYFRIY